MHPCKLTILHYEWTQYYSFLKENSDDEAKYFSHIFLSLNLLNKPIKDKCKKNPTVFLSSK